MKDYKFVYNIKCCEHKVDFDTCTIVDNILSARVKRINKEVIKQLRNFGVEKGINELIVIDESKVLKIAKSLKALDIIKEKFVPIDILMGCESLEEYNKHSLTIIKVRLTKEEYDLLKEVLNETL